MNWHFAYTPYILPMLASAMLCLILGVYAWQRGAIAGARSFALMLLFMMLWSLGAALQLASTEVGTKILWFKLTSIMKLPAATAELCFGIQYAGLGRFLTRRNLVLLSIPAGLVLLLALTNEMHHLLWLSFTFDGVLRPVRSPLTFAIVVYTFVLAVILFVVLIWLFVNSPQHSWPVSLVVDELVIARAAVLLDSLGISPFTPMDAVVLAWNAGAILYAMALFGFRMFDPIPLANQLAIAQMREGMLVLDAQDRVASLNPAAQAILCESAKRLVGRSIPDLLPEYELAKGGWIEISRGTGPETRYYMLETSSLKDWRGESIGRLILLYDATEPRLVQAQLVEQQRALATLQERERLARELHDSIGQVLGYASFQVDAASKLVSNGQADAAIVQLDRLAGIVREAHADVREYILGLHTAPAPQDPFLAALQRYLEGFTQNHNIQTRLNVDEGLDEEPFTPETRMQVFRIFQEAMSNARKHSRAHRIQVTLAREDHFVRMTIQDDGAGFDPGQSATDGQNHFGLQFMRERAEALGGCLEVISDPNQGTRVVARAPMKTIHPIQETEVNHA